MSVTKKTAGYSKLFFTVLSLGLLVYSTLGLYVLYCNTLKPTYKSYQVQYSFRGVPITSRLKHILVWTTANKRGFGEGIIPFIANRCPNTDCYLTTNRSLLDGDYTNFDAIVFNSIFMKDWMKKNLPSRRSAAQKYVFYSQLSSDDAPACHVVADDYFNWTCTYKLDSDIFNPMIEVLDLDGTRVAPQDTVEWETTEIPLSDSEREKVLNKTKAMAWIVDRCDTFNDRLTLARKLRKAFMEVSLDFDIYGCGFLECPGGNCLGVVHDYYFYYAAEDSDSVDYVTAEVVKAYSAFAVPVVRGKADYEKFLPEGSYIDASKLSIDKLVSRIDYTIRNPAIYAYLHYWRSHYYIRATDPFTGLCKICRNLHDDDKVKAVSVKRDFRRWWNDRPLSERCLPKSAESLSYVLSYANKTAW